MEKKLEIEIGKSTAYKGKRIFCEEGPWLDPCWECYFRDKEFHYCEGLACGSYERTDRKHVVFKLQKNIKED